SVSKETETLQTVKLTPNHRTETLLARYTNVLIHRTEPNRPHISSDISNVKELEAKSSGSAKLSGATRFKYLSMSFHPTLPTFAVQSLPATVALVCTAGERGFTYHAPDPQGLSDEKVKLSDRTGEYPLYSVC
ncbi:hypothetical protein, partial [Jannaschia donghaensis]|uniref:hypothetical protein n=1 Tax=Jannaschia donghaensis TaxID=420998 RepID=UPI00118756DD